MNKKIGKLKEIYSDFVNKEDVGGGMDGEDAINIGFYMKYLNELLKEMEEEITNLKKKVKQLEQRDSYYPREEI